MIFPAIESILNTISRQEFLPALCAESLVPYLSSSLGRAINNPCEDFQGCHLRDSVLSEYNTLPASQLTAPGWISAQLPKLSLKLHNCSTERYVRLEQAYMRDVEVHQDSLF